MKCTAKLRPPHPEGVKGPAQHCAACYGASVSLRLMDFAGLLNSLFGGHSTSRRRELHIRTFAVVPLTDECGLLQWVEGLLPLKVAIEDVYGSERLINRR